MGIWDRLVLHGSASCQLDKRAHSFIHYLSRSLLFLSYLSLSFSLFHALPL